MARVKRSSDKSHVEWTTRKLLEEVTDKRVDFDIDIQRAYVWKSNEQKSLLIQSLILDDFVPPLYFNKIDDIYEGIDGKQKTYTIKKFVEGDFALSDLQDIPIINDDGELEEVDINGLKYNELPICVQNTIMEFTFTICFKINADQEEVARNFYNLNNGTKIGASSMNRIKAKCKSQIIELSKHKIFLNALSKSSLENHVNDDLVGRAHAVLNAESPAMDAVWIRKYMKDATITDLDVEQLSKIFDRIYNIHNLIEDKKIAKRIYGRTHMISIVPVIWKSIEAGLSDEQVMEWFVNFFSGKRSATISNAYNSAAGGSGTGKKDAVKKRLTELENSYNNYFLTAS